MKRIVIRANHNVNDLSVRILIASFLAQIFVVGVHHFGSVTRDLTMLGYDIGDFGMAQFVRDFFYHMSIGLGTVASFIIAGYLFFKGFEKAGAWGAKVKRRLATLGIPYLIWNFLASPWFTALLLPLFALFMPWLGSARDVSLVEVFFGKPYGFYPANAPLWFVRELLLVSILSPLLWVCIRGRNGWIFVACAFVAWVWAAEFAWGGIENVTQAIFAFSLGGYWNKTGRSLFSFSGMTVMIAAGIAIGLVLAEIIFGFPLNIGVCLRCVAGSVFIFGAAGYLARTRWAYFLAWLGEASFFIYLVHIIGRGEVSKLIISAINPQTDLGVTLTLLVIWGAIFAYIILAWALLRRFSPQLLNFLLGGRLKNHFSVGLAKKHSSDKIIAR